MNIKPLYGGSVLALRPTRKRAVTPVVATIVLVMMTLVLALMTMVYTFGFLSSNVEKVSIHSMELIDGVTGDASSTPTSYLTLDIQNPGRNITVQSIVLSSSSSPNQIAAWCSDPSPGCQQIVFSDPTAGVNLVLSSATTHLVFYPITSSSVSINLGAQFYLSVSFSNGQSIQTTGIVE
jgi:flagellin-like protein